MISASSMYSSSINNNRSGAVQDKFDRFEAWLASNGARFEQVRCCIALSCSNANCKSTTSHFNTLLFMTLFYT